jgi:hypothetical protein
MGEAQAQATLRERGAFKNTNVTRALHCFGLWMTPSILGTNSTLAFELSPYGQATASF